MHKTWIVFLLLFGLLPACTGADSTPGVTEIIPSPTPPIMSPVTPAVDIPSTQDTSTPEALVPTTPSDTVPPALNPTSVNVLPDPQRYTWSILVGGLEKPVAITHSADGTGRLFVVEQAGLVRVVQAGEILADPFLDIRQRVGSSGSEQGLLGLAFHPQYAQNGWLFVNYTDRGGNTVIARFQVSAQDPNRADPQSEVQLLNIQQPYGNHNGGVVAFGPDGYLYLGLGDGGSGGDPLNNGQSLDTYLGKILRIDVDQGEPYAIPADNPFIDSAYPENWAYGLRNPWRFSFDRQTGDLYIADVGQNQWEEVNFTPARTAGGTNFGWNYYEGNQPYRNDIPADLQVVAPVVEYAHDQGCSVTGGVVYRGSQLTEWYGVYLYGDYCSGRVWGLLRDPQGQWISSALFENVGRITSFGEDQAGEVYLVDHAGTIFTLTAK